MSFVVVNPYPQIINLQGVGLSGGSVYIGAVNQDPQIYPQPVYWDAALTIPASQPLAVTGGYLIHSGSPANAYCAAPYSIRVRDRQGVQLFYAASGGGSSGVSFTLDTVAALQAAVIGATVAAIQLNGYYTAGDGGAALYSRSVGPSAAGKVQAADGSWWIITDPVVNDAQFGTKRDGSADDITALRNLVAFMVSTGRSGRLLVGNRRITDEIALPNTNLSGFDLEGVEPQTCTITQATANKAIFVLGNADFPNRNTFKNIAAVWSHPSAASTRQAFLFCPNYGSTQAAFFNNTFEAIYLDGAHYAIWSEGPSVWGNRLVDFNMNTTCTGGLLSLIPSYATGQPNNKVDKAYLRADAMVGPLIHGSGLQCAIDAFEVNVAALGPQMIKDVSGGEYIIGKFRLESGTYTSATSLFELNNSIMTAQSLEIATLTITQPVFGFLVANVAGNNVLVQNLQLGAFSISGSGAFYVNQSATGPNANTASSQVRVLNITNYNSWSSTFALCNNGSFGGANGLSVDGWNSEARQAYVGDSDLTLVADEARAQVFNTPLTADRTVTLPDTNGNLIFSGRRYDIVKTTKSGAGKLTVTGGVIYNGGGACAIPAASCGRVSLIYERGQDGTGAPARGWTVLGFETW